MTWFFSLLHQLKRNSKGSQHITIWAAYMLTGIIYKLCEAFWNAVHELWEIELLTAIHFSIFSFKDLGHSPLGSSTSRNPRSSHIRWFSQTQDLLQQSWDKSGEEEEGKKVYAVLELLSFFPYAMRILLSFRDESKCTLRNMTKIMFFVLYNLLSTKSFVYFHAKLFSVSYCYRHKNTTNCWQSALLEQDCTPKKGLVREAWEMPCCLTTVSSNSEQISLL